MLKRNLSHAKELEKDVLNQALITSARIYKSYFLLYENRVVSVKHVHPILNEFDFSIMFQADLSIELPCLSFEASSIC